MFILLSLSPSHVTRRDDPNPLTSEGEHHEERAAGVGLSKSVVPKLFARVKLVLIDDQRAVEKDLLALRWRDSMPEPILLRVGGIPLKLRGLAPVHRHPQKSIRQTYTKSRETALAAPVVRPGKFSLKPFAKTLSCGKEFAPCRD
jgi:hypothetical protein